jgi:hypothetical protein
MSYAFAPGCLERRIHAAPAMAFPIATATGLFDLLR